MPKITQQELEDVAYAFEQLHAYANGDLAGAHWPEYVMTSLVPEALVILEQVKDRPEIS